MLMFFGNVFIKNFFGKVFDWYKVVIIVFFIINLIVFFFINFFFVGWLLVVEFIFILVMVLKCYFL